MSAGVGAKAEREDGRRGPRLPVDLEASLGGRSRRKARAVDLSVVGCLLRTEAALARGAVLDLTLGLPDGPLRTKGRVAEATLDGEAPPSPRSFLAGIEFLSLGAADEARLRGFLDAEAKRRRGANTPPA
jgi:PilZ domain-containing protein